MMQKEAGERPTLMQLLDMDVIKNSVKDAKLAQAFNKSFTDKL